MDIKDEKEDESIFEESSFVESEWFEYALYGAGVVALGLIVAYVASFTHYYELVIDSLRQTAILFSVIVVIFCVIKLIQESDLLSSEAPPTLRDDEDIEAILRENEINPLSQDSESTEKNHGFEAAAQDKQKQPSYPNTARNYDRNQHFNASPISDVKTARFTAQLLGEVEWLRFEALCAAYFTEMGLNNRLTGLGADGGIDINIFDDEFSKIEALVQCKKVSNPVSVKLVREFYGVMVSQNISKGYFITSHTFTNGAINFAKDVNLELINGKGLYSRINDLPTSAQARIVNVATLGDYKTASCVKCGTKMKKRMNRQTKQHFWSCPKPKCKTTLQIKASKK